MGLNYYSDMKYTPLSDLFRQDNIKTDNQLMDFYNFIWKGCWETGRSTVAYTIFDKGCTIDHGTHVPGSVAQSSAES